MAQSRGTRSDAMASAMKNEFDETVAMVGARACENKDRELVDHVANM